MTEGLDKIWIEKTKLLSMDFQVSVECFRLQRNNSYMLLYNLESYKEVK
jgi:hypothetical protein